MGRRFCFIVILIFSLSFNHNNATAATQSFDQSNGVLSVDYAGYLSKHNIVFNSPIVNPVNGLTFGTGRVGGMVWNANGITMQVTGVDASPQTGFSEGLVNLSTSPRMDSNYATFQQALSLYDGLITTRYDSNRIVTIMGSPNSEVFGIHVDDNRSNMKSVAFQLSMWDSTKITANTGSWNSMQADVPNITLWKTASSFANSTVAGINRAQTDANNFGYTLAATVEGTAFSTQQIDARTVRFVITPSPSYTIWIACASRKNAPDHNSVALATNLLASAKNAGYSATLAAFTNWWHSFWAKSFVQYSNSTGQADYLENYYCLGNYIIAAGGYGTYPFHFINGIYKCHADSDQHWSSAYWYWNMRDIYNSMLTSNHSDVIDGFYRLYSNNLATLKAYTMTRFSIDGAWTPETMNWTGSAQWTIVSTYTDNIFTTGAEVATNMYMRYAYTNDTTFLGSIGYPYMRETAKFMAGKFSYDPTTGQYYMASSNAHETYWNVKNAITDLAAVRSLFPQVIQAAKVLNLDPDLQTQWQNVLDHLVPFKTETYNGGFRYLAYDPPTVAASNRENIVNELVWPYSVTGISSPDYQTVMNNWKSRPYPWSDIWTPDAVQAARLGMGDTAYTGMQRMLSQYQSYPNGLTNNTNGIFEYVGLHLISMNESLLQSYNDTIRVFPALPNDATLVSKFTLLAKGGFLVSSEKEGGEIKYVGVKSLNGKSATFVNPWAGQQMQVRNVAGGNILLTTSNNIFSFPTSASGIYVIERTAKSLSSYVFSQLTGNANYSVKTMTYNGKTLSLGIGQGKAPPVATLPSARLETQILGSKTLLATGNHFVVPKTGNGTKSILVVYSLSGRQIKEVIVNKEIVDMRKDLGMAEGAYFIQINAISK